MERPVFILTFHGIGAPQRPLDTGESGYWLTEVAFEELLSGIATEPLVQLTFDDGNASDHAIALPALERRGLSATFFLAAGLLGKPGYLAEHQVRDLLGAGMEIGSHGLQHRPWPTLRDGELREEIDGSKARLEAISGRAVASAACPFGAYDRRVLRSLRRAGYERVYTSDGGPAAHGDWLCGRTSVRRDQTLAELETIWRVRWRPLADPLRRLKLGIKRWR